MNGLINISKFFKGWATNDHLHKNIRKGGNTLLAKIRGTSFKAGLQQLHAFVAVLIFCGDNYLSFSRPLF